MVFGFGLDCTWRFSGDRDTRPEVVSDVEVFEEEAIDVADVVAVDTRRLPVKLFNVRRISSLLELAWSNAMVAPDCFESSKKSIPRKVRTNDAVMFAVSIIDVEVSNKRGDRLCCVMFRCVVSHKIVEGRSIDIYQFEFCEIDRNYGAA